MRLDFARGVSCVLLLLHSTGLAHREVEVPEGLRSDRGEGAAMRAERGPVRGAEAGGEQRGVACVRGVPLSRHHRHRSAAVPLRATMDLMTDMKREA